MSEHWEEEGRFGHPLIATLAGAAILVLAALAGPRFATPLPLPALLIGGAAAGLVLWLIGFVITTRHAKLLWKLGSLVVLIGAGLGAATIAHSQFETRSRADASTFAEIELAPDGSVILPFGAAGRGPVSALYVGAVQAEADDKRDYNSSLAAFGVTALNSPYLLKQNPHAIENCGKLDEILKLATAQSAKRLERRAALAQAIGSATLPKAAKQGITEIVGEGKDDQLLANQRALLETTGEICRLLARKTWENINGYFGFRNPGDIATLKAIEPKRAALSREADAMELATRQRIAAGREKVRDALSRSIYDKE